MCQAWARGCGCQALLSALGGMARYTNVLQVGKALVGRSNRCPWSTILEEASRPHCSHLSQAVCRVRGAPSRVQLQPHSAEQGTPHFYLFPSVCFLQNATFPDATITHIWSCWAGGALQGPLTASLARGPALAPRKHLMTQETDRRGDVNGKASVAGVKYGEGQTAEDL